jgi:hypothetical protein
MAVLCSKCATPRRDKDQEHPGICVCGGFLTDELPERTETMADDRPRNDLSYDAAMHGVQAGVAMEMNAQMNDAHTPKHLRVGINSAMVNDAAMVRLLVKKGLITEEEYAEEVRLEANRELDRYEDRLRAALGNANINLR